MNIFSTKILEDDFIVYAKTKNFKIFCEPFIKITPIIFNLEKINLSQYDAVVFTSYNAITHFFSQYKHPIKSEVFALKKGIEELQSFCDKQIFVAHNSLELATLIISRKYKSVLHICGDKKLDIIAEVLKINYIQYDFLEVYANTLIDKKTDLTNYEAILFFSPSGVESFFKHNHLPPHLLVASIGLNTSTEIKKYTNNKIITSTIPDIKEMLNLF